MTATVAVKLRPPARHDLPVLFRNQRDPLAVRMADVTSRDEAEFRAHWEGILADPDVCVRVILAGGEVAGHVTIFTRDGRREVGYWIGREYWGRGIATRALAGILAERDERPLHAWVACHNPASLRVLEKCGFRRVDGESTAEGIVLRLDAIAGAP